MTKYIYIYGFHVKYPYSCQILKKLEFSGQIFEKYSIIKFHENPSSGRWAAPFGETDSHDETNRWFLQFCECLSRNCRNWNYLVVNPYPQDKRPASNGRRHDSSYLAENQYCVHYKDQTVNVVCYYNRTQQTNGQFHNVNVKLLLDSSCEGRGVFQVSEDLHPPCVRS
jgi:hypothetical protein